MTARIAHNSLRRFTTIGAAVDMLRQSRVAFLNPSSWDDRNDAYFMDLYREASGVTAVHAMCCTQSAETYHHWKVFTSSTDGVLVDFDKARFLESIVADPRYLHGAMRYLLLDEMRDQHHFAIHDLPFLKRRSFEDEREYRIIFQGGDPETVHYKQIELGWIRRIVINPWLPHGIYESVRDTLLDLAGSQPLHIRRSAITSTVKWRAYGKRIVRLSSGSADVEGLSEGAV